MEETRLYDMDSVELYELIDQTRVELKRIILNTRNCQIIA